MASSSLDFQEEQMRKHETSDVDSPEKLKANLIQAGDGEETIQGCSPAPELGEYGINNSDLTEKQIIADGNEITSSDENKILGKRKLRSDEGEELPRENVYSTSRGNNIFRGFQYQPRSRTRKHPLLPKKFYTKDENELVEMELVNGHAVKATVAPTVRFIFAKYGDIAFSTWYNYFHDFCGTLLEMIADVVKKIVSNDFCYILSELDGLKTIADVAAMAELDVAWLQKELAEIDEVRNLSIKAAMRDFDAKEKIMSKAKKQLKEVQRRLDHVGDNASAAKLFGAFGGI